MRASEESYRLYSCRRCAQQVRICRHCDHGHQYCAGECARLRRRESLRRAGARYQLSYHGACRHAARQRVWRARRTQKVTYQGSPETVAAAIVAMTSPTTPENHADRAAVTLASSARHSVSRCPPDAPLDNEHFPWLTGQVIDAGLATDVYALRVNFIGELGWELHLPIEYANGLFDALFAAGEEFGIGIVGMGAMESLRIEKRIGCGGRISRATTRRSRQASIASCA